MITDNDRQEIVKLRLENAWQTMKEAKLMSDNEFWNAAINRMYYACYYAVSALLIHGGIEAHTHAGVRQMFGLHFIRTSKLSQGLGRFYSDLFTNRHSGDYDDFVFFEKETIDKLYPQAIDFIQNIESLINNCRKIG